MQKKLYRCSNNYGNSRPNDTPACLEQLAHLSEHKISKILSKILSFILTSVLAVINKCSIQDL